MNNIFLLLFLLTITLFILSIYYKSKILKVLSIISCLTLLIQFFFDIKNKHILNDTIQYDWTSPESTKISVTTNIN